MAFVSAQTRDFPTVVGENFSDFVELSSFHKDGWGIAINNAHKSQVLISRAPERASTSATFDERIHQLHGDGGLLHLRWATSGLENCDENTHPFVHGEFSFIHNGSLHPYDGLDSLLEGKYKAEIKSESDSHRFFMLLAQSIAAHGLEDGILDAIKTIRGHVTYASLNSMLLSE